MTKWRIFLSGTWKEISYYTTFKGEYPTQAEIEEEERLASNRYDKKAIIKNMYRVGMDTK